MGLKGYSLARKYGGKNDRGISTLRWKNIGVLKI